MTPDSTFLLQYGPVSTVSYSSGEEKPGDTANIPSAVHTDLSNVMVSEGET